MVAGTSQTTIFLSFKMTKEAVETVLGKALLDAEFRAALFAFPEDALAGFRLSATEKNLLKRVDSETLDFLTLSLAERLPALSKGYFKEKSK
jgi:hypothetical protein